MAKYLKCFDEQIGSFNERNTKYEYDLAVSKGGAAFDETKDKAYKDVFKRADEIMYKDKEAFYRGRNDRRKR